MCSPSLPCQWSNPFSIKHLAHNTFHVSARAGTPRPPPSPRPRPRIGGMPLRRSKLEATTALCTPHMGKHGIPGRLLGHWLELGAGASPAPRQYHKLNRTNRQIIHEQRVLRHLAARCWVGLVLVSQQFSKHRGCNRHPNDTSSQAILKSHSICTF